MVDVGLDQVDVAASVNAVLLETGSLPKRLAGLRDVLLGNTKGVEAFNVAARVVGAKPFLLKGLRVLLSRF